MFKPSIKVSTITDDSVKVAKNFRGLESLAVYVGVPEKSASRKRGEINNAELTFLMTHGVRRIEERTQVGAAMLNRRISFDVATELYRRSHGNMGMQIPPAPIIEPAIEADKEKIIPELREAAVAQLAGNRAGAINNMRRAGMTGQNVVKGWFFDSRNNWPKNAPATIKRKGSDRRNIDTSQLLNSMTWVLGEDTK